MKTAKELAQIARAYESEAKSAGKIVFFREIAAVLDRLAAYEAPLPELAEIEERHRLAEEGADVPGEPPTDSQCDAWNAGHHDRGALLVALKRERAEKEALVEGIRLYRAEECPFAKPAQITEWERKHGHLVKEGNS